MRRDGWAVHWWGQRRVCRARRAWITIRITSTKSNFLGSFFPLWTSLLHWERAIFVTFVGLFALFLIWVASPLSRWLLALVKWIGPIVWYYIRLYLDDLHFLGFLFFSLIIFSIFGLLRKCASKYTFSLSRVCRVDPVSSVSPLEPGQVFLHVRRRWLVHHGVFLVLSWQSLVHVADLLVSILAALLTGPLWAALSLANFFFSLLCLAVHLSDNFIL